jgi:hypothetical protein
MTEIKVKVESDSPVPPGERGPCKIPTQEESPNPTSGLRAATIALVDKTLASAQDPQWKACSAMSQFRRLQIKEHAVKVGIEFLDQVKAKLRLLGRDDPACKRRIETIGTHPLTLPGYRVSFLDHSVVR